MVVICPKCGAENNHEYMLCWKCGALLRQQDVVRDSEQRPDRPGRSIVGFVVGTVIAVIVLAIGIILISSGVSLLGTSQRTTSLYTFVAGYWDMNQLQAAIMLIVAGSLLTGFAGVFVIVSSVIKRTLR